MKKSDALLVIDVQNDFCPGGCLAVPEGDGVLGPINRMSGNFQTVAATRDWHPPGHASFAASWEGKKPGDTVSIDGLNQYLWPEHCVRNTRGAQFHENLDTRPFSLVLNKGRSLKLDSYSAFFENDRKTPTGLSGYLGELGATKVYVCGLATDYCVFFTVMDALSLGLAVVLVEDAVRGVDLPSGGLSAALDAMKKAGTDFLPSGKV
ncbi:MAG: bifunctional nicotinamidase/pyrazinamidase [Spirochaetales bacterium]|nr:MAG: bifunctional nicotinamidase/pyrazinamidase [Spirochaetales bacterium]